MQKYRLKKDLFYTKKGDIVSIPKNPPENYGLRPMYSFSENSEKGKFVGIIHKDDISKWLEEIPEKPKSVYDLRCGDIYYICTGTKYIEAIYGDALIEDEYIELGMAFVSLEELEKERKKRRAIQKIKKYCWENGIDTEYEEERNSKLFYIETDGEFEGQINFDSFPPVFSPIGYFSYENADKILKKFPEELKLILS